MKIFVEGEMRRRKDICRQIQLTLICLSGSLCVCVCVCVCRGGANFTPSWFCLKSKLPQSPDIGHNPDRGVSDFQISGQSPVKENCHNYRISDNIDMILGLTTKFDKRNSIMSKNLTMTSFWQIMKTLSFFYCLPIWSNLEPGFQIFLKRFSLKN